MQYLINKIYIKDFYIYKKIIDMKEIVNTKYRPHHLST